MNLHYRNYYWKEGKPMGIHPTSSNGDTFKVISDPYRKRFSVEHYLSGKFIEVIYDSNLFDFRHLKQEETAAWQREWIEEFSEKRRALIRNMDERIILIEEAHFQGDFCTGCTIYSPQGIWIATQKIQRTSQGDHFNGVTLMDRAERPVLIKKYSIEDEAFALLLSEQWVHYA